MIPLEAIREIEEILNEYEFTEILYDNDITEAEAMYYLYRNGIIKLPETKPLTAGSGGPVRFDEVF